MVGKIIGLYSPYMQAGKTTVADYLVKKHKFVRVPFANPLKDMLQQLLQRFVGVIETEAYLWGDKKEEIIPELNVTARHMMQTLGTEWGRNLVQQDLWTLAAKKEIDFYIQKGYNVVVDDMRFSNEYYALQEMGATLWAVSRPTAARISLHASEGQLDNFLFDEIIVNSDSKENLENKVESLLNV